MSTSKIEEKSQSERIEELSQEIFGKPSKDIKYVLITNYIHQILIQEEMTRTGLYQWLNVFNGTVNFPRDIVDYNDYDIVQVNMAAQDIHLIGNIREALGENSKTKLVVNNDYTSELWGRSFDYPSTIARELQYADMLFGTEYFQTTALSELAERKCFVIPHPADIKRLKSLAKIPKKKIISTVWRRYDPLTVVPYVASLAVRNHGLTTQLIGYDRSLDPKFHLTSTIFDYVNQGANYFDFCDQLRESYLVYDPFTFHSYSRTTVDTAALGVPVVVSNRTQSANICYPHTAIDPYDVSSARTLIQKLINDEEFYDLVVNTAYENCEFYNHENSMERYLSALKFAEEDEQIKKKRVVNENKDRGRGDDALFAASQDTVRRQKSTEIIK